MKFVPLICLLVFFASCGKYNIIHYGCESPCVYVKSDTNFLFMPNIFSPNGDGNNDYLAVISKGVSSIFIKIHDNAGTVVCENQIKYPISNTTQTWNAWDGAYKKIIGWGEPHNNFHYVLDFTFSSGGVKSVTSRVTAIAYNGQPSAKNTIAGVGCIEHSGQCVFGDQFDLSIDSVNLLIPSNEYPDNCP